ncbi:MAG: hypothetical protein WCX17_04780 [Parcubacteria group bacterium]
MKSQDKCKKQVTMWYYSKRLLLGVVTLIASYAQFKWGMIIDGPTQGLIVGILILIIGIITKTPIAWEELDVNKETEDDPVEPDDSEKKEDV